MMINRQFSKCPVCKKDEKYRAWVKVGNATIEVSTCASKCLVDGEVDKPVKGSKK